MPYLCTMASPHFAFLVVVLCVAVLKTCFAYSQAIDSYQNGELHRHLSRGGASDSARIKKAFGSDWKTNLEDWKKGGAMTGDISKWLLGIPESSSPEHFQKDIARSLTGKYYALYTKAVEKREVCPKSVKLLARVLDGMIKIPLPGGLKDPLGLCRLDGRVESSYITLSGKSPAPSRMVTFQHTAPMQKALMSKIPKHLMTCPGGEEHPFESITVTPLNRYLVPILIQNLKAVGISKETISNIFDDNGSMKTWKSLWLDRTGARCKEQIREALSHLRQDYVLSLNRKHDHIPEVHRMSKMSKIRKTVRLESSEHQQIPPSCVLLGGSASKSETAKNMEKFVSYMNIIFTKLPLPLPRLQQEIFFATNADCQFYSNGPLKSAIKILSKVSPRLRGPYGWSPVFGINFAGNDCGTMQVHRFSEAYRKLGATTAGISTRDLAGRITRFLQKHAPVPTDRDTSHPTFTSYFPDFQTSLRKLRFKSAVFVARVSFSQCPEAQRRSPIELVLVQKPVSFFYCNGFTKNSGRIQGFCRGEMLSEDSEAELGKKGSHGMGVSDLAEEELAEIGLGCINEYSVFISKPGLSDECIYSSSISDAYQLRKRLGNRNLH